MKVFKKLAVLALVLTMIAGLFPARGAQAATKPAKAKVTAKVNDDGTSVTLTIAKTKNAQGYKIMVKKPGASKFTKLTTLKKDGTAARTYTAKKLTEGEYQFKVRAYLKNGSKTVWGKYSKVVKVTIGKNAGDDKKDDKDNGGKTANTDLSLKDCLGKYANDAGNVIRLYYDEENKKYRISGTKFDVLGRDDALFDEKVLKKQSDGSLSSESDLMKLETLIGSAGSPLFYGIVIDTDGNITLRTGNFASGWIDKGVTYHKQ